MKLLPTVDAPWACQAALSAAGLVAVMRADDPDAWDQVWQALPYQGCAYAASMIDYQHSYFRGAGWTLQDLSLVLLADGKPCGIWPLMLGGPVDSAHLSSSGTSILAPALVNGLSPRSVKKIYTSAIEFLRGFFPEKGLTNPMVEQSAMPGLVSEGVTEWHQRLIAAGAVVAVRHDLYADLRPALPDIRARFRKSFRPLCNVGLRTWNHLVIDQTNLNESVWTEFKELHRVVAGRVTRSDETWAKQLQMISANKAFFVSVRDPVDQRLVGGAFFQCTRDEGIYAVSAYDRLLFDKPLGHAVQQIAIETMKSKGLSWYRIGERLYPQDQPKPTDKEVHISEFKQGFASHLFPRFDFCLPVSKGGCLTNSANVVQ